MMSRSPAPLAALALGLAGLPASAQMTMPPDPAMTCEADVAPWFGGTVTPNGAVTPPNSATFTDDNPNGGQGPEVCNFYQWGAQMFLWLTSPDGDGLVLDSAAVFNVLPQQMVDGKPVRKLQVASDGVLTTALRAEKDDDQVGEVGQAGGGGVLLAQPRGAGKATSLVYYGVHVNNVYAYFLTGQKAGGIAPAPVNFPSTADDLAAVATYISKTLGVDLPKAELDTMTMELKTSWIDAAILSPAERATFVTMPAIVPTYTANDDNTIWTPTGSEQITLALVGMHVVGTVQDHPEFVWATFEHVLNAPDVTYHYTKADGTTASWPFDSDGDFLFLASGAGETGNNTECAKTKSGSAGVIEANATGAHLACSGGIVPSNTIRMRPWGSEPWGPEDVGKTIGKVTVTEAMVDQILANNTLLLSLNASVRGQLASADVRGNYVQTGGIWTTTPAGGGEAPIPNQTGDQSAQMRGSLGLYNATMETYSYAFASHCFACHSLYQGQETSFGTADQPDQLSHIYYAIQPLE